MTTPLTKPVSRLVNTTDGPLIVTLDTDGVHVRAQQKSKDVHLPYHPLVLHALRHHRYALTLSEVDHPLTALGNLSKRPQDPLPTSR